MRLLLIISFLFTLLANLSAQKKVDSLLSELNLHQKEDTVRVNLLNKISDACSKKHVKKIKYYSKEAIRISQIINYKFGEAEALYHLGYAKKKNYSTLEALNYYFECSNICKKELVSKPNDIKFKTLLLKSFYNIGYIYYYRGIHDKSMKYLYMSLELCDETNNYKFKILTNFVIGTLYKEQKNYGKAIAHMNICLELSKKKYKKYIGMAYNNLGAIYGDLEQYDKASRYLNKSLEIHIKNKNKKSAAYCYNNLGLIAKSENKYDSALVLLYKALEIRKEVDSKNDLVQTYYDLGDCYLEMKNFKNAEKYLIQSLNLTKKLSLLSLKESVVASLSDLYAKTCDYKLAYRYQVLYKQISDSLKNKKNTEKITKASLKYEFNKKQKIIEDKFIARSKKSSVDIEKQKLIIYISVVALAISVIIVFIILRSVKLIRKKNQTLIENTEKITTQKEKLQIQAEKLSQANEEIITSGDKLASQNKKIEEAYTSLKLLSKIGREITSYLKVEKIIESVYDNLNKLLDASVFSIGVLNEEKDRIDFWGSKENGKTLKYHYDSLSETNSLAVLCYTQQKDILISDFKSEYELFLSDRFILKTGEIPESVIYLPLIVKYKPIGVISVQSFKKNAYSKYHANIVRNIGINAAIALDNAETYKLVKSQHEELKSSMRYARNIQNAMLPMIRDFDRHFINYIIYKPKDIVSGDFYWYKIVETDEKISKFIAVSDCTGHGIPGAFMSLIGNRLFNEIVNQRKIYEPEKILNALNLGIKTALKQEQTENQDGMDVCLCRIDYFKNEKVELHFSGAKRPLFIYYNEHSKVETIKGNIKSIGSKYKQKENFTKKSFSVKKNDMIWLTTDGYVDQNNKSRKKFGTRALKNLFRITAKLDIKVQKRLLEAEFNKHKGDEPQRDDVTVIGVKI